MGKSALTNRQESFPLKFYVLSPLRLKPLFTAMGYSLQWASAPHQWAEPNPQQLAKPSL